MTCDFRVVHGQGALRGERQDSAHDDEYLYPHRDARCVGLKQSPYHDCETRLSIYYEGLKRVRSFRSFRPHGHAAQNLQLLRYLMFVGL